MNLNSMTGFARCDGVHENLRWHWEIKTVNGKAMDVRCRLPHGYERLEPDMRKIVAKYISRGNCQLLLSLSEESETAEVIINERALASVSEAANRLVAKAGLSAPSADGLLAIKGIVEFSEPVKDSAAVAARSKYILNSLETALDDLVEMRQREGEQLGKALVTQLAIIEELTLKIRQEVLGTGELIRARVARQVAQVIEASNALDQDRLYQEAIILATKSDITEELDRLDAHILAARSYLTASGPVGRKLEFLIQEFNRETNTLCAKSPTREISALGLDMKSAIDQIREQVMNIE